MLNLATAQLKQHRGRYLAMVLAILVGIAFFTAALAAVSSAKATLTASLGAQMTGSNIVVTDKYGQEEAINHQLADKIEQLNGVNSTHILLSSYGRLINDAGSERTMVLNALPLDEAQIPFELSAGELPQGPAEVIVDAASADQHGIELGQQVNIQIFGPEDLLDVDVTVTGIYPTMMAPNLLGAIQIYADEKLVSGTSTYAEQLLIRTAEADTGSVIRQTQDLLSDEGFYDVSALSIADYVDQETTSNGDFVPVTLALLMFAFIAIAVMMLVINNTFAVIVAQRTRELGLLRLIGTTKQQLFRMVLVEAALIGFLASLVGLLIGLGLLALALNIAGAVWDINFINFVVEPTDMIWPLLLGTMATVLAAWRPAGQATKVVPIQALAPELMKENTGKVGALQISAGLSIFVVGTLALIWFVLVSPDLLFAVLGGLISFIGVLLLTPLFVPPLVSFLGIFTTPLGTVGSQAKVNAARHPRRTATTAAALLIGTTLVMMMVTGAESIKHAVNETLNEFDPLDVVVSVEPTLTPEVAVDRFRQQLVQASELVQNHVGEAAVIPILEDENVDGLPVYVVNQDSLDAVSRIENGAPASGEAATYLHSEDGSVVVAGQSLKTTDNHYSGYMDVLVNASDFGHHQQSGGLLVLSLAHDVAPSQMEDFRDELAQALGVEPADIQGNIFERMVYTQIINTILSVVNALLAVALVIAFIGVANTLTLSTIERRKENGLLRAIGLTRAGLRNMLILEAVLISIVAVVFGSLLGVAYGWFAVNAMITDIGNFPLLVPWGPLATVLAAGVVCAVAAAAVPAHRALKSSPVEALTQ